LKGAEQTRRGLAGRVGDLEAELKAQGERTAVLELELTATHAKYDRELTLRRALECRVAEQEARLATIQSRCEELLAQQGARAALVEEAARLQANLDQLTCALAALTAERDQLAAERDALTSRAAEAECAHQQAEAERVVWEARAAELTGERDRLLEAAGRLRIDSKRLRRRLGQTRARARAGAAQRRILAAHGAAEMERLGHDLDEARRSLGERERAWQELSGRVVELEGALQAERARAAELSEARLAVRRESEERRGLAGRLWLLLQQEQGAGERARAALERAREQTSALEDELTEARQALAGSRAERDTLRARLEETEARLKALQEESVVAQQRLDLTLDAIKQDHMTLMRTQDELTQRAEVLLAELAQAQQAAAQAEAALQECRCALAAALEAGESERRRADELERELTTNRAGAQTSTMAAAALEQEKRSLEAEVARLRAAAPSDHLSTDAAGKATFWEGVGSGSVPLDPAWLRLPALPPSAVRPAARGQNAVAGATTPEQMLRGIGERPPDRETLAAALKRLGPGGFATILATADQGDAAVRRGAGRVCAWVAEEARKVGAFQQARGASEQALRLFGQLACEPSAEHAVRAELALAQLGHARSERRAGRNREALDLLMAARETARALVAEQPGVGPYRRLLARSLHDLGVLLYRAGRQAPAEGCLRAAVSQQAELVRYEPQTGSYAVELEQMKTALERCLSGQSPSRSTHTEPIHS
jgi:hypothetical protein